MAKKDNMKVPAGKQMGPGGKGRFGKPQNVKGTFFRILRYLKGYWFLIALVFLCITINSLSSIAGTYFLMPLINEIFESPTPDMTRFANTLTIMAVMYAISIVANYLQARIGISITSGMLHRVRTDLFSKMQKLPIRFFDTNSNGDLMSRFTNDTDAMRQLVSQSIPNLFSSLLTVVGVFVMMVYLSPVLTIIVVAMLVVMTVFVKTIGGKSAKNFMRQQAEVGRVNGYIEEMITGQKVVKVFNHEQDTIDGFNEINNSWFEANYKANALANILFPILNNLSHINYAITATVGALLSIGGIVDLGTLVSFLTYTRNFSNPIGQISQQITFILSALAGAERIFKIIDETPETDEGYVTLVNAEYNLNGELVESEKRTDMWAWKHPHSDGTTTYTLLKGDVVLDGVTFGYEEGQTVLNNVSLYAKPGQKIAFVGSTGAGKTTITNLLNRFYDVEDGKIRYDGININKIKKADLRRSLAMVLQDTHLFTGTVRDNIRYGRLDATDEQIRKAAKIANAEFFIEHLPDGYDTVITGDGANLSQGQRQLLAIARAAVADPPVLILDEATSSIDTRTEAHIEKGMDTLMHGRTVFVIAHRLSTVRNSDAIMVLEKGEIIERGNHDQLIEQQGKYYQLYTGMFELD